MYADEFSIYAGNANRALAERICRYLKTDIGEAEVFQFANENIFVRILDNVREQDVFLVQPTSRPVNDSIMELLIMIDAFKRASAGRITAVIPYYSYGRSDKKDQPQGADHGAPHRRHAYRGRRRSGPHHGPAPGPDPGFLQHPGRRADRGEHALPPTSCARSSMTSSSSPISGSRRSARAFAERLNAPLAIVEKRRVGNADHADVMNVIGEVRGQALRHRRRRDRHRRDAHRDGRGAAGARTSREIYSCASHGVFSKPRPRAHRRQCAHGGRRDRHRSRFPPSATTSASPCSRSPRSSARRSSASTAARASALCSAPRSEMVEEMTFWDESAEEEPTPTPFPVSAG